ncbi:MAG: cobalamin B12-binding domain-containing protein [Nannocystaceae bacterium]
MILLATLPSDAHSQNLLFLQRLLQEHGFEVRSLGVCTPVPVLLKACIEQRPSVALISATNGHHDVEGAMVAQRIRERLGQATPALALAGDLNLPVTTWFHHQLEAGYDEVFQGPDCVRSLLAFCYAHAPSDGHSLN